MKRILIAFVLGVTIACVGSTEPRRSRLCWYPGDTIAMLEETDRQTRKTIKCHWVIADKQSCFDKPVGRLTASDCVLGTQYRIGQRGLR